MPSELRFDDRAVIVTGAGRGLGRGYARLLAARGARVVVNDLRNAPEVVAELEGLGGKAVADGHDISTEDGARGLVQTAVDAFGAIDAIVNNAGVFPAMPFPEMTWDVFDLMQRVHIYGPFFTTRYAWPYLVESGRGRVVMVSAKATLWGETRDLTHYGTAKGAVLGMTRQLAMEGAEHGICVNAVLPSALTGVEHPRARWLAVQMGVDPDDRDAVVDRSTALAAAVVAWLCHPDCTVTGEFIRAQVGEVRRVSYAMTRGINDAGLTLEKVRDRFPEVLDPAGAAVLAALFKDQAPL
ncbi:SDR family NAD(P)-dependent oxidoreductase [Pseudofrankia sp. DC12]|uniref:SDR family NAD(P)-dependent oxidoreductase n=1 Tax=Pseudofrankia sp. DC12 TaxID=683315 RepID=UPI0005F7DF84|nr:SDR family NAD(P)-dependent oxidoreductase [Pseudofrankia sp. DC12]